MRKKKYPYFKMLMIKTTLITTLIVSLTSGVVTLFQEKSFGLFLYMIIMTSGNVIFPILIGTLIYEFIKRKIKGDKWLKYFILKVIVFGAATQVALIIWSALDIILYYGNYDRLTIDNIVKDYKQEFLPWVYIVFLASILIPTVDKELTRQTNNQIATN